jgi:streptogramin lyase
MSRRTGRLLTATLAVGLVLSLGSAALAAPVGGLKQYRVPTANSDPRAITNGSDGNVWFTEGTGNTNEPAKIARITPAGAITEFAANCDFCIPTDIVQGASDDILYLTANDPSLLRFDLSEGRFLEPIPMPNGGVRGGALAAHGSDLWITDFNNDVIWRFDTVSGVFTSVASSSDPSDVAVDAAGNVWFTEPQANLDDGTSNIGRIDAVSGEVTRTVTDAAAGIVTVSPTDGKVWFAARFPNFLTSTDAGVGYLDPANDNSVSFFPVPDNGPAGLAAADDGTIWFTQTLKGNIAKIDNNGVITEAKTVRNSGPFGIVVAPNNDPWYTMMDANKVATLQLR